MSGKHSTKYNGATMELPEDPGHSEEMPDPDNLHIDTASLPLTAPIVMPPKD
ncbi:MAG: hypothetical protein JWP19_434 [Rhodoglobus sp.]|nr:hypothetical protein [Rhodoglobus sp.]